MCAFLRFHFRMTKREWDEKNFSEKEVIEMYAEYLFVKRQFGEIKDEEK